MRQEILDTLKRWRSAVLKRTRLKRQRRCASSSSKEVGSGKTVGFGGSMTVNGLGIPAALREQGNETYFHWEVAPEERPAIWKLAHTADVYMMSTNAVTEDGVLLNIDGNGNRVAAPLICGPQTVYILAGENKFVTDNDAAMERG